MAKFFSIRDDEGLICHYVSCDNKDCFDIVWRKANKRALDGQYVKVESFEASKHETCDNSGTWEEIARNPKTRRAHYLDTNLCALSDMEVENLDY